MSHNADNTWTSDALGRGDVDAIQQRVFNDSAYMNERDYLGNTPLLNAIHFGNLKLVAFLLAHGANPNVEVDDGYTCLLSAVESEEDESTSIVAELIQSGAGIHGVGHDGWTPLHMAARFGYAEKARLLIDAGADVNRRQKIDLFLTPLMEAAFHCQPATVRLLLEHGADPSMRDTSDRTALEIALDVAKGPDADLVEFLALLEEDNPVLSDVKQRHVDESTTKAKSGNCAEVIRLLTACAKRSTTDQTGAREAAVASRMMVESLAPPA